MKLAERTFKRKDYYITSHFGYRKIINASKGPTNYFHSGVDYGTRGEKWPQYALENGTVISVFEDYYGAKCLWVKYPRLKIKLLYAHLDSISVKRGQKVNNDVILGYTGQTGNATGIHLHLGLKNINDTSYIDPEKYDYREGTETVSTNFLGSRGYIKFGDQGDNISKIAKFMRHMFPAYTPRQALGNYYGKYIQDSIKEFQRRTRLEADGCIGPITLAKLKSFGFKE